MSGLNEYKPAIAMFLLQFTYAGVSLSTRTALLHGMSPRVFVFYRQAIATLVIAPLAYFSRYIFLSTHIYVHVYMGNRDVTYVNCTSLSFLFTGLNPGNVH